MNRRRLLVGGAGGLAAITAWALLRGALATRIAGGVTVPVLGAPLRTFGAEPLALVDRYFWLLLVLYAVAVGLAARYRPPLRRLLFAPGDALDLAVTRVVVFGVLALLPRVPEAVALSSVPAELRRPPAGAGWLLDVLPPTPGLVRVLAVLFVLSCIAACIGLYTRAASVMAVVLGLYVLGVPQFYGKVSHYHHLLWIAAVLAAAPSAAALSVDAMRRAWRSNDPTTGRPTASVAYGFPLRVIWVLIAITYLFPGIWKFASAGIGWALSDNLRTVMYEHWTRLEGFVPILPVDRWPAAYQLGGLFTLLFELSFVFLLWAPWPRLLAAAAGLVFHNLNLLFLRLSFATLQLCYVAFVPWQRLADRAAQRVAPVEVAAADVPARRLLSAVRVLDPVGRLHIADADAGVATRSGDQHAAGWEAVVLAVRSVPLAWPLLPALAAVPNSRRRRLVAAEETDSAHNQRRPATDGDDSRRPPVGRRGVAAVGTVLILGNSFTGLAAVTAAWPFACYPTFAGRAVVSPEILFVVEPASGRAVEVTAGELRDAFTWEKLDGLSSPILRGAPDAEQRARALLETAEQRGVDIPRSGEVAVYRSTPQWTPDGTRSAGRRLVLRFER